MIAQLPVKHTILSAGCKARRQQSKVDLPLIQTLDDGRWHQAVFHHLASSISRLPNLRHHDDLRLLRDPFGARLGDEDGIAEGGALGAFGDRCQQRF